MRNFTLKCCLHTSKKFSGCTLNWFLSELGSGRHTGDTSLFNVTVSLSSITAIQGCNQGKIWVQLHLSRGHSATMWWTFYILSTLCHVNSDPPDPLIFLPLLYAHIEISEWGQIYFAYDPLIFRTVICKQNFWPLLIMFWYGWQNMPPRYRTLFPYKPHKMPNLFRHSLMSRIQNLYLF